MLDIADIRVPVRALDGSAAAERAALTQGAARRLRVARHDVVLVELRKRSIDARRRDDVRIACAVRVRLRGGVAAERAVLARLRRARADRGIHAATSDDVAHAARVGVGVLRGAAAHAPAAAHVPADRRVVVVGAGCAGLMCALALARAGLRPLLVERGDDVARRGAAIARLNATGTLDAESNVQFGLGGAGTFSDGKLATGTSSPAHAAIIAELIAAGAPHSIRYDAHPHIGSDLLPGIVTRLVGAIEAAGGEVRTRTALTDLHVRDGRVVGVTVCARGGEGGNDGGVGGNDGGVGGNEVGIWDAIPVAREERIATSAVVLACGHSARDVFALLAARGVTLEPKAFAMGVRIEHAQAAINAAQHGSAAGHPSLGAAPYKLACHVGAGAGRRGVFSFCMCPGGYVVAAASEPGGVVTNGMSLSGRAGNNANAGLLVDVRVADVAAASAGGVTTGDGGLLGLHAVAAGGVAADAGSRLARGTRVGAGIVDATGVATDVARTALADVARTALAGVALQRACEQAAFAAGGGGFVAPTQLVGDFLAGACSTGAGGVAPTYPAGVAWGSVAGCLPAFVVDALREGIPVLGRRLRGFDVADAVLTAVETRSSSPVRVTRGADGASVSVAGLYPCGEGAGYAGGIMSAATDGLRAAAWVADALGA